MSGVTSSRGHTALAILRLAIFSVGGGFLIEPLITFSATLCECWSDTREQLSVSVSVIVLVSLAPMAIADVENLVLFSAGSSGCAYSVGGHSCCHIIISLEIHNQNTIIKYLLRVSYFSLL